jgi:lysophospholipase L1-like esterase
MTYHINADFLPASEFVRLAAECRVPLLRNDAAFARLMHDPTFRMEDYFHHDHWHPNARGYAVMARDVLDAIRTTHLLEARQRAGTQP